MVTLSKWGQNKKIAVAISYVTMLVQFAAIFFVTPYILQRLGNTEFGLYQLVASTASYLSLLGLGFSAAYIRFYTRFKTNDDEAGIASLNGMFMTLFLLMATACVVLGFVLCLNIETVLGDKLESGQYEQASKMLFMLALNIALTFPRSIFVCNTTAHERFVFQKSLVLAVDLITPFLQVAFVFFVSDGFSLTCAAFIATIIDLAANTVFNLICLKMRFSFKSFDFKLLREISAFTFWIFLNQVLDMLSSVNIDNYLIGRIVGPDSVTIYSMGAKINQMFYSVAAPISAVFVPMVYQIVESTNDKVKLSELFTKVGKIQFAVLFFILVGFILWGKEFMFLWLGSGFDESYYIAIVLMASLIVALSQNIGIEIQRAENKHKARSVVYLVIDIGNVFISIPLIMWLGPIGAAFGTALSMLLGTVLFMNWYYRYSIGLKVSGYWTNAIRIALCGLLCFAAVAFMRFIAPQPGLLFAIAQIAVYAILYCSMMYAFVLDSHEKEMVNVFKRLKGVLR